MHSGAQSDCSFDHLVFGKFNCWSVELFGATLNRILHNVHGPQRINPTDFSSRYRGVRAWKVVKRCRLPDFSFAAVAQWRRSRQKFSDGFLVLRMKGGKLGRKKSEQGQRNKKKVFWGHYFSTVFHFPWGLLTDAGLSALHFEVKHPC